jgi:outer membrane receptor protein involved in Fe transport
MSLVPIRTLLFAATLLAFPAAAAPQDGPRSSESTSAQDAASPVSPAAPSAVPGDPAAAPDAMPADPAPPTAEPEVAGAAPPFTDEAPDPGSAVRGVTGVCGTVVDAATGEPLIDAPLAVVKGGAAQARSDVDGRFTLRLPPGLYDLRARYELYEARRVRGVGVVAGECTPIRIELAAQEGAVEEVVVTATADSRREAAVLAERKSAPVMQDTISAQEISRTPDSAASDAVKRVVSATVVDGKYVYLRGLGGRYSSVLLNGVPLPSPDADEHAVPLDLLPTSLLSSLNVVKTYSPNLPGSFAGGTLDIETTSYPARFEAELSISSWASNVATGKTRRTQGGGTLDWLTIDDGDRALPDLVPTDGPMVRERVDDATLIDATRDFSNDWTTQTARSNPGIGLGATAGDTRVVGGHKLGYLLSLDYGLRETVKQSRVGAEAQTAAGAPLEFKEHYDIEQGSLLSDVSGLANIGFEIDPDNDLTLLALYTRSAESNAQKRIGTTIDGSRYDSDRLQFVARGMLFSQLRGEHTVRRLGDLDVSWQGNFSWVTRDEPDTRDVIYFQEGTVPLAWAQRVAGSSDRFFSEVRDLSGGGGLDLAFPVLGGRLRTGAAAQLSNREFEARKFHFTADGADIDPTLSPDLLFASENVSERFFLQEYTSDTDAYTASQNLYAGYLSTDMPIVPGLRGIGGVRFEHAQVDLTPGSRYAASQVQAVQVDREDSAFLPSANIVWALLEGMNLRAAYSYTLVRPQFRELAEFEFVDYDRKRTVTGNSGLETTRIHNADVRWEWFPREDEVLAASVFHKAFEKPIEAVITNAAGGSVTYRNAPGATVYGAELEARLGLGRFAPSLADLRAAVNLALVHSQVDLEGASGNQTSTQRPLQGQSPYVVNASLGWSRSGTDVTALYNVYGERITEVGFELLPDAYEQPFHRVDLTLSHKWRALRAKLAVTNLLDSRVVIEQGGLELLSYEPGLAGSVTLEWSR